MLEKKDAAIPSWWSLVATGRNSSHPASLVRNGLGSPQFFLLSVLFTLSFHLFILLH